LSLSTLLCAISITAHGQVVRTWDGEGGANNNWTNEVNWSGDPSMPTGLAPAGSFNEVGVIDTGATVLINSDLATALPGAGYPGGLAVSNNSQLQIEANGVFNVNTTGLDVDGSVSFTSGATLSITGSSASFTSESLSFGG